MTEKEEDAEQQQSQREHEMRSVLKHHADLLIFSFAVTPRDKNLDAYGEAHCQGGKNEVVQSSHHGGTQLVGAEMAEESRVGESDDGLGKVAQHDGIGNTPNLAVGYTCRSHALIGYGCNHLFALKCR